MTPDLICERLALEELGTAFNDIVARHGLDAREALLVAMTHCSITLAGQYSPGEGSKKDYRRKVIGVMDTLVQHHMPVIITR